MSPLLGAILRRFRGREDSEHEQAIVRLAIAALILAYLAGIAASSGLDDWRQQWALEIILAETLLGLVLVVGIAIRPGVSHVRRVVGMVGDFATLAGMMSLHGAELAPLYIIYLWVTIGNGLRYGTRYLVASTTMAAVSFLLVVLNSSYWKENSYLAWGLWLGLFVIPSYLSTLIRELTAARDAARDASLAKTRFLANMSHEFRTPLNGIVGSVELLGSTRLTPEQRESLEVIRSSSSALLLLVEDVLDISAIEAGKLKRREDDFRLRAVLRGITTMLQPLASTKGLAFETDVAKDVPDALFGDSGHLRQILVNLLGNAIKFTERGSVRAKVTLEAFDDRSVRLRFAVADTGIGIPAAEKARIFEPFEQVDTSLTRRYAGTGLGTTIARTLTELLGGTIGVDDNPGGGTIFWVVLPFLRSDVEAGDEAAEGSRKVIAFDDPFVRHRARVRPLNVLAADDQSANQVVLKRLLEKAGHSVFVASSGDAALDALAEQEFDVAIVDIHMPGMSGTDVMRHARFMQAGGKRTPFVALSADATPAAMKDCEDAGASAFLCKPVVVQQLLDVLADIAGAGGEGGVRVPAPAEVPLGDEGAVDAAVLEELAELKLGKGFVTQFVEECLRDASRCMGELERAGKDANWDDVREHAHALKGVCGNMGAVRGAALASEVMRLSDADLKRDWAAKARMLRQRIDEARGEVLRVVEGLGGGKGEETGPERA
jgi:two-component system sensor histidine kinase RpfC